MDVTLQSEWQAFVEKKVQEGEFATPGEVIQEGLRLLRDSESADEERLRELRLAIAVGVEQSKKGDVRPFDPKGILAELRQR